MLRTAVAILVLLFSTRLEAKVVLPRILGHGMVLQQKKHLTIWGTASVGEQVIVEFAGQKKKAVTNASGKWRAVLNPLKASSTPSTLVISGTNTIRLNDVLVGEVWLCSGQSNMEYTMRKNSKVKGRPLVNGYSPADELKYAKNSNIRIFLVNRKELIKPDSLHRGWSVARDSALRSFSAAGYFFAKELYMNLNVPIGIISSAVPGSALEPWVPADAFTESPRFKDQKVGNDPGKFYDPMIAPLIPFAIKGFLWYQGETNCFLKETLSYTHKMETLVNSWREAWNDKKLPFYYVQIAPFKYSESKGKVALTRHTLPEFREAQTLALKVKNTGMIVTTDLADNLDDIHPGFKWEIGRRLALVALDKSYGFNRIVSSGPVFHKMKVKGNQAQLRFNSVGSGLISKDGQPLSHFLIAGSDGQFFPAEAKLEHNKLIVWSEKVAHPTAVRFAWDETAQSNFYNKEGLPARPFRSDNPLLSQYSRID